VHFRQSQALAVLSSALLLAGSAPLAWAKSIPNTTAWGQSESADAVTGDHKSALLIKSTIESKQAGESEAPPAGDENNSAQQKEFSRVDPTDAWTRYYEEGQRDYVMRRYETAEARAMASVKVAKQGMSNEKHLIASRILLAKIYLAKEAWDEAEKLYSSSLNSAKRLFGEQSAEVAECDYGLGRVYLTTGKFDKAEALVKGSVTIREKLIGPSRDLADSLILRATLLGKTNWVEQSEDTMRSGIKMYIEHPGQNPLDLADAFRQAASLYQSHGRTEDAAALFDRSFKVIDQMARLNLPPQVEGEVPFRWEEGSPRSQEIPDNDFPLKYLSVNNVRVAATLIDLWELVGVLISVTNTGDERVNLGLGKPTLYSRSTDEFHPHRQKMEWIDPDNIDRIRRERVMWDLTQNRPWLANMQKTRNQRGFVPPQGHDLFRGPNVFGVYGEWGALPRDLPSKFMLEPSPERVQYQAQTTIDPGLVRSSTIKIPNLIPLTLEPFESRTGEMFFLSTRPERLVLTVPIGNVIYEIPFVARRKRIK
jgi:tetratricopeptide (TPR) repeat protein